MTPNECYLPSKLDRAGLILDSSFDACKSVEPRVVIVSPGVNCLCPISVPLINESKFNNLWPFGCLLSPERF